ncbi:MAG: ParA family protein [Verrucomicrobiales bacterium]|nr:ParA family protein [Verrucomicrobiales bacterium]
MKATISFINQKGGCGKSSTCFHLSGAFAEAGFRVLLVDADPQGSLSQGFFGSAVIEALGTEETLAAIFDDECFAVAESLPAPTPLPSIAAIRANHTLAIHNVPAPERTGLKQFALRSLLSDLSDFDLLLIDCPPNLYQCSWNALLASDFVVVPVPPEDFATQGLRTIHLAIANAAALRPQLRLLGHLVTRADRRLLVHRSYEQRLRALYGPAILDTVVPEASAFKVALSCRQPVSYYGPNTQAARVMNDLASELMRRMRTDTTERGVA